MTMNTPTRPDPPDSTARYLDLLRSTLTFSLWDGGDGSAWEPRGGARRMVARAVHRQDMEIIRRTAPEFRGDGRDWPRLAHTRIGERRMRNLQECVEMIIRDEVPGDLIEIGVWRGGACILMQGVLATYGAGDQHHQHRTLPVSIDQVQDNFRRYGLLDERVRFLPGWFRDTLPKAPIDRLAVLRLDGDWTGVYWRRGAVSTDPALRRAGCEPAVPTARHDASAVLGSIATPGS
ncbi:O-methyltransferase [Frankia sp. AiPs1]